MMTMTIEELARKYGVTRQRMNEIILDLRIRPCGKTRGRTNSKKLYSDKAIEKIEKYFSTVYERRWKQEEIDFIIQNYTKLTYKEMANILNRTPDAIRMKARKLGLHKRSTRTLNVEKKITDQKSESLCFHCAKARADRCEWIGQKKKIWTNAVETKFIADRARNREITIYKITECPYYEKGAMRANA